VFARYYSTDPGLVVSLTSRVWHFVSENLCCMSVMMRIISYIIDTFKVILLFYDDRCDDRAGASNKFSNLY
jgi:hypothetical protein